MTRLVFAVATLALFGAACTSDAPLAAPETVEVTATAPDPTAPRSITRTATPIVSPSPEPIRLYPLNTRSRDATVDQVLDVLTSGDEQLIGRHIRESLLPCVASALGSPNYPICPDGVAEGTALAVVPTPNCQPNFGTRESAARAIVRLLGIDDLGIHSIGRSDFASPNEAEPAHFVIVLYSAEFVVSPRIYANDRGEIVHVLRGSCLDRDDLDQFSDFILFPRAVE